MPFDPIATARTLDHAFRATCARLDRDDPWFGTYTADLRGRTVEYRVGNLMNADERIVDWRHPLARVFYEHAPGDDFDLDDPRFADVAGTVTLRGSITSQRRSITRIDLADPERATNVVAVGGEFVLEDDARSRIPPEGLPDIRALLTPEQYRLITSSRRRPVVIQGRAGSGKTTVALYRVSWLTFPDTQSDSGEPPVAPENVLIVMFNRALRSFVDGCLRPLGLGDARLDTFHAWALDTLCQAYRGDVEIDTQPREGADTASALKKQLGILRAIDEFVDNQERRIDAWLESKLQPYEAREELDAFRSDPRPVARKLIALRTQARRARDAASGREALRQAQIHKVFHRAVERTIQYKDELLRFLSDTELLARHLPDATADDLDALARFQREVQNVRSSERRTGPLVRFEDLALLLWLIRCKHGGYPDKLRDDEVRVFDHLVVDEAQDFGAVELGVLLSSVRSRTGVTIVGDVNQKIMPEADFMGWDRLVDELGVSGARVAALEVGHRSTEPIMALADALVGDETPAGRPGAKPRLLRVAGPEDLAEAVAHRAEALLEEDATRHVCIVVRRRSDAAPFVEAVREHLPTSRQAEVRLGHNKKFCFEPGITVTNMRQIKGLEFEAVIVVEPSATHYPEDDQGRRWLYTVLTRAKDHLDLVGIEAPTPLLQPAIEAGLLQTQDETALPEVVFDEGDDEPF